MEPPTAAIAPAAELDAPPPNVGLGCSKDAERPYINGRGEAGATSFVDDGVVIVILLEPASDMDRVPLPR